MTNPSPSLRERARQAAQDRRELKAREEADKRTAIERRNVVLANEIVCHLAEWAGVSVDDITVTKTEQERDGRVMRVFVKIDGVTLSVHVQNYHNVYLHRPCSTVGCDSEATAFIREVADIDTAERYCSDCPRTRRTTNRVQS